MNLSSTCIQSAPLMRAVIEKLEHGIHAADVLLEKWQTLFDEIEETQNHVKSRLIATLVHHVAPGVEA
jgi:hypothetical protein